MRTLFLSDGENVKGPFVESQIASMWNAGTILADAQVCEEGTEDWFPASMLIEDLEGPKKREAARMMARKRAAEAFEREKKSGTIGVILSIVFPFGGQLYAGGGILFFIGIALVFAFMITFTPVGLILWLLGIFDSPGAVSRYNAKLAASHGLAS